MAGVEGGNNENGRSKHPSLQPQHELTWIKWICAAARVSEAYCVSSSIGFKY